MKRLVCTVSAAVLLLALCACGTQKEYDPYKDAGYYDIFTVDDGDRLLTKPDFDALGRTVYLLLYRSGTGVYYNDGDATPLTWSDGVIRSGGADMLYTLVDGMLTLDLSGEDSTYVIVFKKATPPPDLPELAVPTESPAENEAAQAAETPQPAAFEPVSAKVAGGRVTILSAERFRDYSGRDAVRFYYDFTYSGKTLAAVGELLRCRAQEDGVELSAAYASYDDDVPEYGNDARLIEPGITIRCIAEYAFRADGSELRFTLSDGDDTDVTAVFDPGSLPGRPAKWTPKAVDHPRFFRKYPAENTTETAGIALLETERAASDPGYSTADVVRVYVDYTNLGTEAASFESDHSLSAYQDGIALDLGTPAERVDSYANGYADVAPGDTITLSRCWTLRTESPVEIVVTDWRTGAVICAAAFSVTPE